jgi:uncharacterized protein YndB with AHSA1/START domain
LNDSTADRECVHSRHVDAPPDQVFGAFAAPERLARWWGPNGFSSTFEIFEFRPGGRWEFVMHGPDGADYANQCILREIVPAERLVIDHLGDFHHFLLTITLDACDGGTQVGWRQVFDTPEHRDEIASFVQPANEQNLDRLAAEVRRIA